MVNLSTLRALAFAAWASMTTAIAVAPPVHPEITLCGITYESTLVYSTPTHMAVSESTVRFVVNNSVLDYTLACLGKASRYPDNFYGDIGYDCQVGPNGEDTASFMFSRDGNHIMFNQTWVDEKENAVYLVTGSGDADLDCSVSYWTNSNWTIGEIYSITTTICDPTTVILS